MIALVLTVPSAEAELASDALWALGVVAIEERDPGGDTPGHLVELWTSLGDDVATVTRAAEAFPMTWRWRLVEVDESVADTWRQHVAPTWITSDLVVCPAWMQLDATSDTGATGATGGAGVTVIRIEPGSTFGLGDHPTTVLSLRAMLRSLSPGATVLDVGTGSGVLAVVAARSGAGRVEAIDISPASVEVVASNARRNGVEGAITASTTPLAEVEGPFEVVVANILAPTLIELAPHLSRLTAPAGVLIVSGVLANHHEHVEAALAPMHLIDRDVREGWAALTFRW